MKSLPRGIKEFFPSAGLYLAHFTSGGRTYQRTFKTEHECLEWVAVERAKLKMAAKPDMLPICCSQCLAEKPAADFIRPDVGLAPAKICNECFLPGRILVGDQWRVQSLTNASARIPKPYQSKKWSAKMKGLSFELSLEKFAALRGAAMCECCSKPFDGATPQIDRVNNELPYTDDNCHALCWTCNTLKRNSSLEDLRRILAYMLQT